MNPATVDAVRRAGEELRRASADLGRDTVVPVESLLLGALYDVVTHLADLWEETPG